ncbi:MAG TPA: ABC transporter ATP-binding protein [Trebonia sp.]|jgi:branched-chain amino acid transport system ATP-binding protein|nr:ABC transporter ATP-binding protein [Trebonia sp.]
MSAADPILKVTDVEVRYGAALALSHLSLDVRRGKVLAVLGPNGAGKSTIARAVSGLVPVKDGSIEFDGQDITREKPHQIRRRGLVHLPEGRGVFTGLTVSENLRMAAAMLPRSQRKDAADKAYGLFEVLGQRRRQTAGTLSGGEQQMVSLARALILNPTMVVADEMSLGLAPLMVDVVFDGLERARDAGVTIVIIEQFVHRALAFADDCVVISRGQAVWHGSAKDAKDEVLQRYLGTAA